MAAMIAFRAAALVAMLLLGGCAAGAGSHVDPRGRCQDPGLPGGDAMPRSLWYLFCVQSP